MRMGVGERLADLRSDLERGHVVDRTFPKRLAQRSPGHVFVGDVDVARVACERVRALAARLTEPRGGGGLSLGSGGRLPLAGDDLWLILDAGWRVLCEPDQALGAFSCRRTVA